MSEVPTSRYRRIPFDLVPSSACRCSCRKNHPWMLDVCCPAELASDPCPGCATAIACAPVARQVY